MPGRPGCSVWTLSASRRTAGTTLAPAPGCRILTTMLREMGRRSRYALETMCIGGGQGLAAVFERVA
jgi:acetyl-CoA acetyltransferase